MFGQMTVGDKLLTVVGIIVSALVTLDVIGADQSESVTAAVNAVVAAVLALRARPPQAAAIKPVLSAALSHWRRGVGVFLVMVVSWWFK